MVKNFTILIYDIVIIILGGNANNKEIVNGLYGKLKISNEKFVINHSEQLRQKEKLDEIKKRVNDGQISVADFDYLTGVMQLDSNSIKLLKDKFLEKDILVSEYDEKRK